MSEHTVTTQTPTAKPAARWYRYPLVWLVISIPAAAVLMGIIMTVLAVGSYDGLVADDYYKRGLEINQSMARDQHAEELGLGATVQISEHGVSVELHARDTLPKSEDITLNLYHSTRDGFDRTAVLQQSSDTGFTTPPLGELPAGIWRVQLETPSWRLTTTLKTPLNTPTTLRLGS